MAGTPILHVFVVGFHHKKGCQVEYCYPPLNDDKTQICDADLPEEWHLLPSLALPDGAHNVQKDTVYFVLPCREQSNRTIYGVSCYRQMASIDLVARSAEVTRSSVQKSVCVLSRLPLFGVLKAKLELITQAYFNERDFAKVEVLSEMYQNLCSTVLPDMLQSHVFIGLSACDLVRTFRSQVLILFKLLLLEKRVLFYNAFPVDRLCETLMALLSLYPDLIQKGLSESSVYVPRTRRNFANPESEAKQTLNERPSVAEDTLEALETNCASQKISVDSDTELINEIDVALESNIPEAEAVDIPRAEAVNKVVNRIRGFLSPIQNAIVGNESSSNNCATETEVGSDACSGVPGDKKSYSTFNTDDWGFPLSLFTKGALCHPYLPLGYLDAISQDNVRATVFTATNALFRHRKDLVDVIVTLDESEEPEIHILDADLAAQLQLSRADLRFAEFLVKTVTPATGNIFLDATSWEGGEEWLRLQFRAYLLSLMASVKHRDSALLERDFGERFVEAWKTTHNFRVWSCGHYPALKNAVHGHPFAGQMSINDWKLRFSHTMQVSSQGKLLRTTLSSASTKVGQVVSWLSERTPTNEHKQFMLSSSQPMDDSSDA